MHELPDAVRKSLPDDTAASCPPVPTNDVPITPWMRWFLPAALGTLGLDLLTKQLIFALDVEFPHWIERAYNPGVAWSLFAHHPWLVLGLTVLLIPILCWVWWSQYRPLGPLANLACGLVLGGAVGNAVDRIATRLGHMGGVRDFIHVDLGFPPFDPWPTFNIADSGICVGFVLLALISSRVKSTGSPP